MNISRRGYRMLRIARIVVSLAVMAAAAAGITIGAGSLVARWQVVPALLACSALWLLVWAAVTLVAGRLYCSTACPLGTLQDCFIAVGRRRHRFHYRRASSVTRRSVLVIAVICGLAGFPFVTGLLDPAAAFSRICVFIASPAVRPMAVSMSGAAVAGVTLVAVAWVAATRGRRLCNTVCPAGTLLGAGSRLALYRFDINTDLCIGCNRCVERCKSECIDPSDHTVDPSRCVVCFDCAAACPAGAITLRRGRHRLQMPLMQTTPSGATACSAPLDRRRFLSTLVVAPAALVALAREDGASGPLNAVTPPGSGQKASFSVRCTGCGACVAACPAGIIRPATRQLGVRRALHPVLDFDRGACIYECVRCTEVCPTGALTPMTPGEKRLVPIGKARLTADRCIEYADGVVCGRCERRCPAGAISIVPVTVSGGGVRRLPRVNFDDCIGCGACRYVCPADPKAWIIEAD